MLADHELGHGTENLFAKDASMMTEAGPPLVINCVLSFAGAIDRSRCVLFSVFEILRSDQWLVLLEGSIARLRTRPRLGTLRNVNEGGQASPSSGAPDSPREETGEDGQEQMFIMFASNRCCPSS